MGRHQASASRVELLLQCQWWAHANRTLDDRAGEDARAGTEAHAVLAAAVRDRDHAPDWAQAAVVDVPADAPVETKVALDTVLLDGRTLPAGAGPRDYGEADNHELPGTADVWWLDGDTLVVRDWKCGERAREHTTPAADNGQLAALALALVHVARTPWRVRLQICFCGPGRAPEVDEHETTAAELRERWETPIAFALDAIEANEEPAPQPGPGCHWCPARHECPEAIGALVAVEREVALAEQPVLTTAIASPEHAASIHVRLKLAKDLLDRIGGALKEYVREQGGIDLGGGKVLRVVESSRTTCALSKLPPELREQCEAAGAVSVSMFDMLREGNAEPRKRARKTKES